MGKAMKIKKRNRKNHANIIKDRKRIDKNREVLKNLNKE